MVIVKIWGLLGNQMFEYAMSVHLRKMGYEVKYDITQLNEISEVLGENKIYELFDIPFEVASNAEILRLSNNGNSIMNRLRRQTGFRKRTHVNESDEWVGNFNEEILHIPDNRYLEGYWQAEQYFKPYDSEIRDLFKFKEVKDAKLSQIKEQISNEHNSVAVHIRLGDYLSKEHYAKVGGICDIEYYQIACDYIESVVEKPKYYLFSNEPEKARKFLEGREYVLVDSNDEKRGWKDMMLMSYCKHNIIANSSFSWWGAWLNNNDNKIVVMPKKWMNDRNRTGVNVDGWVRI